MNQTFFCDYSLIMFSGLILTCCVHFPQKIYLHIITWSNELHEFQCFQKGTEKAYATYNNRYSTGRLNLEI